MSLVLADRVRETTTSTGTGTITLGGAVSGFQSFSVIGNNNTTYYTISGGTQWEVGIGTYYGGTLARTTVISSSTGSKLDLAAGTKDVFVTYPAEKSVNQDANNRVLIPYTSGITDTGSLNVGSATLHTDSGVIAGFTASEPLYLYTSLQNTDTGATSYASYAVNDGGHTAYGELGINNANYSYTAAGFPNNGFSIPLATFVQSYGGPLVLGSWDNQKISFIVNGAYSTTDVMTINTNGSVAFNGQVGTAGQVLQSNATSAPTWVTPTSGGTVTSVSGTGTVSGLTLTGTVTSSGSLTLGGAIAISGSAVSGNIAGSAGSVTNALTAGTGISLSSGTTYDGSAAKTISSLLAKSISAFTTGAAATYTAPANTQWLKITAVGKGGNGGGTTSQRGSGGGAGGIAIKWLAITAGETLTYTVSQPSLPNFVTSGTYTLASDITAYGGTAGTSVAYAASFTAGGLGGTATGGDVNIRGGYGGSAFGTSTAVTTQQSGFGGSNMFGAGGYAVGMAINAGVDGLGYGAGGSGSIGSTTVGLGTSGIIIFEAY